MARDALSATTIADDLLQRSGAAMLSGDAQAFVSCFALPQEFETASGKVLVQSRQHLTRMFLAVQSHYKAMAVTDMVRHVVHAEFRNSETITFTHESRLLQGNVLLQEAFYVFSIVKLIEGEWLVAASTYGPTDDSIAGKALNAALWAEATS